MAQQTFQFPASTYSDGATFVLWGRSTGRPQINADLRGTSNAFLANLSLQNDNGTVNLSFSSTSSGGGGDQSLSDAFEASGGLDITVGSLSLSVNLAGADTTDPYNWIPSNSAEVIQWVNDVFALTGNQAATLVIRDFEHAAPDTPVAPTLTALSSSSIQAVGVAPDEGSDTITSYDWRYRIVGNSTWTDRLDQTNLTQTFTGLDSGTEYEVQFRATNSVDDSAYSPSGTATTNLPDAVAPTATITSPAEIDERVTLGQFATATVSGGTYDTLSYGWSDGGAGGQVGASGANVFYAPPDVSTIASVTLSCQITASGTGTNAADGTSATVTATRTLSVRPETANEQIFTLPGSTHTESSLTHRWEFADGERPPIINILKANDSDNRFLAGIVIGNNNFIELLFAANQTEDAATRNDLADIFETDGAFTLVADGRTLTLSLDSADLTEPYRWQPSNTTPVSNFRTGVGSGDGVEGVLTLDSGIRPDAVAPTVTIAAVTEVDEDDTLALSASVSGGTYDSISYAWAVDSGGGSISGTGASVTYNPPDVSADTAVTVSCTVTATGDGTLAKDGTTDDDTDTEEFTVRLVLPDATAPTTFAITAVDEVDEDETLTLTVTHSGGTYDTIDYIWQVLSGGGSISGTTATATYTPPSITVDTEVTVAVTGTARGTGTLARNTSFASTNDQEVFTVRNVEPLTLADILVPVGRALVGMASLMEVGSSGDVYNPSTTVVDGADPPNLGDSSLNATRIYVTANPQLRISEDGSGNIEAIFSAGGSQEDYQFHIQTSITDVLTYDSDDIDTGRSTGARILLGTNNDPQDLLAPVSALSSGDRVIFFLTMPQVFAGQALTAVGTISRATLVVGSVAGVTLSGQPLASAGTISSATLVVGTVPGVTLSGRTLSSSATLSRATLNVGAISGAVLSGQTLSGVGTISRATLVAGTIPAVTLSGQTLSVSATVSQATLVQGTVAAVTLSGRPLTSTATISQAELVVGTPGAANFRGRILRSSATISRATLVTSAVPGVTLSGQSLSSSVTISQATLSVGTVGAVTLRGRTLAGAATISAASLNVGGIVAATLTGQTLASQVTISEAALSVGTVADAVLSASPLASLATISRASLNAPTPAHLQGQALAVQATISRAALIGPPEQPSMLEFVSATLTEILIEWRAPDDGGSPITRYEIRVDAGTWMQGTTATMFRITGLVASGTYSVSVRAVNAYGTGEASAALIVRTVLAATKPRSARSLTARPTGETSIDLVWDIPLSDGGDPITHYEICVIDADGRALPFEYAGAELNTRVRGLAIGHQYGFRVRAVNGVGTGPQTGIVYAIPKRESVVAIPAGQRLPLLDVDRQSMILRLANNDCRVRISWNVAEQSWFGDLEVPVNTAVVQGIRLAVGSGILDRIQGVLPGNIVCRNLDSIDDLEPARDAWARPTHALVWEPE